jgi:hypothetical protein
MILLLTISTAIQAFDVYLDWRQKQTYENKELPPEFKEGFELADKIDRDHKKGAYEEKKDEEKSQLKVEDTPQN